MILHCITKSAMTTQDNVKEILRIVSEQSDVIDQLKSSISELVDKLELVNKTARTIDSRISSMSSSSSRSTRVGPERVSLQNVTYSSYIIKKSGKDQSIKKNHAGMKKLYKILYEAGEPDYGLAFLKFIHDISDDMNKGPLDSLKDIFKKNAEGSIEERGRMLWNTLKTDTETLWKMQDLLVTRSGVHAYIEGQTGKGDSSGVRFIETRLFLEGIMPHLRPELQRAIKARVGGFDDPKGKSNQANGADEEEDEEEAYES